MNESSYHILRNNHIKNSIVRYSLQRAEIIIDDCNAKFSKLQEVLISKICEY